MRFDQRAFEEFEDECRMICDQNNLYVNTGNMQPKEWALINFVNDNYPTIKNRESMHEVAYLWCFYGLGIFKVMAEDAGAYYRLNIEVQHAPKIKPIKAGFCAICGGKVVPGTFGHHVIVRLDNSRFYFHTTCTAYMKKEGENESAGAMAGAYLRHAGKGRKEL